MAGREQAPSVAGHAGRGGSPPPPHTGGRRGGRQFSYTGLGLIPVIVLLWIVFSWFTTGFASSFNLFALGRSFAVLCVVGFSMMVVLAVGHMNIAVGSMAACVAVFTGWLLTQFEMPLLVALFLPLCLGVSMGVLNGWITVKTGINSFIVTLAMSYAYLGLLLVLTRGHGYSGLPVLPAIGSKAVYNVFSPLLLVPLVVGIGLSVLYGSTVLGQQMLAVGANPRAAEISGIRAPRLIILSHGLAGGLVALAAFLETARLAAALPITGGDWMLPAFLIPVLGGTLLSGGRVSVGGTVLGALLVATLQSGLQLFQVGAYWLQFFLGLMLLAVVLVDRIRHVYGQRRLMGEPIREATQPIEQ